MSVIAVDSISTAGTFLTPDQVEEFGRTGFLYVPGAFSRSEVRKLVQWTQEVQDWPEVPGRHMAYYEDSLAQAGTRVLQRIENFVPFHSGFSRLIEDPRMLGAASQLFGDPAVLFKDKINFKLPGGDGYKAHQDQQAGWSVYAPLFITVLVAIDEQTIANGCLEMASGYHRDGMIGPEWNPLPEEDESRMTFVPYPTQQGDVMYFDSYAPHRSLPNLTDKPRRVLYITYNASRHGDQRVRYFADKRASYPPDVERQAGADYKFRV